MKKTFNFARLTKNFLNMAQKTKSTGDERLDNIGSTLSKAEHFIDKHKKIIIYSISGIALIILSIWGYNNFIYGPKVIKAENEIYMAQMYYEMDSLNLALNGDGEHPGFLEIIDNYGGTPSGNLSHYYVGMIYLKQGLFEDAISELKKFKGKDNIIGPMATGCIGDAYLELGDHDNALKYYIKASKQSDNSFTTPMYLMRAAWVYEDMGNWDDAIELYEKIRNDYRKSYEGSEVNKYIARATAMKNTAQ